MKKIELWQIGVMLIMTGVFSFSCEKADNTPLGQKLFEITVPADWMYYWYNDDNFLYNAESPERLADDEQMVDDTLKENVEVIRYYYPGKNLDLFYDALTTDYSVDTSYHEIYSSDTVINDRQGKKLIHLQTIELLSFVTDDTFYLQTRPLKYIFYKDEYGYLVSCNAMPFTYEYYEPIFEDIISTFQFKEWFNNHIIKS